MSRPDRMPEPAADDPARYTLIGHGDLALWHPHDADALVPLIDALGLTATDAALDVGCGAGEVALRIVERTGARVDGVDISPGAIARGRHAASTRDPAGRLTLRCAPFDPVGPAVQAVVCLGASHAIGDWRTALDVLRGRLLGGGRLLVGEGYWIAPPPSDWLETYFGGQASALPTLEEYEAAAAHAGYAVVARHLTSDAGRAAYERRHNAAVNAWAEHTDAPDGAALAARSDRWFAGWQAAGERCLGFGLWVLERR